MTWEESEKQEPDPPVGQGQDLKKENNTALESRRKRKEDKRSISSASQDVVLLRDSVFLKSLYIQFSRTLFLEAEILCKPTQL